MSELTFEDMVDCAMAVLVVVSENPHINIEDLYHKLPSMTFTNIAETTAYLDNHGYVRSRYSGLNTHFSVTFKGIKYVRNRNRDNAESSGK